MNGLIVAHDLVGVGKVAASIALPLLAVCQIETYLLPTVLLSSHTGGFPRPYIDSYQKGMEEFLSHWEEIGIQAEALFLGYCPSIEQVHRLHRYQQEKKVPLLLDPILGDRGQLYTGFHQGHVQAMRELCQHAQIIFPNLTEAALLTDTPFLGDTYTPSQVEHVLDLLGQLGPKQIVLTGLSFSDQEIGIAYRHQESGQTHYIFSNKLPGHFYGSGDCLSALLTASYLRKIDMKKACQLALDFLEKVLTSTSQDRTDRRMGLLYEPHLGYLFENMNKIQEK